MQKNYPELQILAKSLKLDTSLHKNLEKYKYVVRTILIVLKYHIKTPDPDAVKIAFEAFVDLLKVAAHPNDLENFVSVLSLLTRAVDLENCLNLIMHQHSTFAARAWLRTISDQLAIVGATADVSDAKLMFMKLTTIFVTYVKVEIAHFHTSNGQMLEAQYFLAKCIKLKCFNGSNDTDQYRVSFQTIKDFLSIVESPEKYASGCERMKEQLW